MEKASSQTMQAECASTLDTKRSHQVPVATASLRGHEVYAIYGGSNHTCAITMQN